MPKSIAERVLAALAGKSRSSAIPNDVLPKRDPVSQEYVVDSVKLTTPLKKLMALALELESGSDEEIAFNVKETFRNLCYLQYKFGREPLTWYVTSDWRLTVIRTIYSDEQQRRAHDARSQCPLG